MRICTRQIVTLIGAFVLLPSFLLLGYLGYAVSRWREFQVPCVRDRERERKESEYVYMYICIYIHSVCIYKYTYIRIYKNGWSCCSSTFVTWYLDGANFRYHVCVREREKKRDREERVSMYIYIYSYIYI